VPQLFPEDSVTPVPVAKLAAAGFADMHIERKKQ
jgi:hypothetical protein